MKVTKAVIPAAGLGTRMLPATKTIPKEMLPLVDKPVIQYIIEEAVDSGIEDILVVTNRAKSAMDDYFDYHPELEQRLLQNNKLQELEDVRIYGRPREHLLRPAEGNERPRPRDLARQAIRRKRTVRCAFGRRYHDGRHARDETARRRGGKIRRERSRHADGRR